MKISDLKNYTVVEGTPITPKPKTPISNKVANFFGAKGITEQFGADIARAKAPEAEKGFVEYPKMKEVVGSAIQTGANLIPGAGTGLGLAGKVAVGAGTGAAFDVGSDLQAGNDPKLGIGTAVGGAIPVAGAIAKPATKIVGRLFKGLGSGLSGVSAETIDKIVANPKAAQLATDKLAKSGNAKVLEENARQVMGGISKVRGEARKAYGEGLEQLSKTDIKPEVFRAQTQGFLDKYGISKGAKGRVMNNVEFNDPKNIEKASALIDRLSDSDLDGKAIRKLADDIDSAKFKIATSDERLAYNAFLKDMADSVKGAVSKSTNKLGEIDKAFSNDMQLVEAIQNEFGKVKFSNLSEVVRATKKLEDMFAKKGIAPDVIDKFLTRIGISPEDFKTGEAVRQISNKAQKANEVGLGFGEFARGMTSAVITPQMVRDVSIKIGLAENKLLPELQKLSPSVRNVIMNALVGNK